MNYKLLNLLIFITAWGLTTPAQALSFNYLKQQTQETQHLVCHKQAQHWLCDDSSSQDAAEDEGAVQQAQVTADSKSPAGHTQQALNSAQQKLASNIFIWLSYLLPCGLGLGLFLHRRHSLRHDAVLQKQIETLERLWQYGSDNDATSDTGQGTGS